MDKNSSVYNSSNQKQEIQLAAGTAYAFEESPGVVFRDAAAAGSDAVRDSVDRMTAPSLSGPQRSGSPYLSNCGWNSPLVPLEGTFETLVQWSPVTVPSNTAKFIGDEQKGGMLLAASVSNAESQASGSTNPQNSSDQHFRTKLCPFLFGTRGECAKGQECSYAHSLAELRSRPDLTKTKLCDAYMKGRCQDPGCKWAHGRHELRFTGDFYKTSLCKYWVESVCYAGASCRHAHGDAELRTRKLPARNTSTSSSLSPISPYVASHGTPEARGDMVQLFDGTRIGASRVSPDTNVAYGPGISPLNFEPDAKPYLETATVAYGLLRPEIIGVEVEKRLEVKKTPSRASPTGSVVSCRTPQSTAAAPRPALLESLFTAADAFPGSPQRGVGSSYSPQTPAGFDGSSSANIPVASNERRFAVRLSQMEEEPQVFGQRTPAYDAQRAPHRASFYEQLSPSKMSRDIRSTLIPYERISPLNDERYSIDVGSEDDGALLNSAYTWTLLNEFSKQRRSTTPTGFKHTEAGMNQQVFDNWPSPSGLAAASTATPSSPFSFSTGLNTLHRGSGFSSSSLFLTPGERVNDSRLPGSVLPSAQLLSPLMPDFRRVSCSATLPSLQFPLDVNYPNEATEYSNRRATEIIPPFSNRNSVMQREKILEYPLSLYYDSTLSEPSTWRRPSVLDSGGMPSIEKDEDKDITSLLALSRLFPPTEEHDVPLEKAQWRLSRDLEDSAAHTLGVYSRAPAGGLVSSQFSDAASRVPGSSEGKVRWSVAAADQAQKWLPKTATSHLSKTALRENGQRITPRRFTTDVDEFPSSLLDNLLANSSEDNSTILAPLSNSERMSESVASIPDAKEDWENE